MSVLASIIRAATVPPVFVTGGPARTPFDGQGLAYWPNPAFSIHHARSWGGCLVKAGMLPLKAAWAQGDRYERVVAAWQANLEAFDGVDAPVVARFWGPLTLAGMSLGVGRLVPMVANDLAAVARVVESFEARVYELAQTALALGARIVWVAEPVATLVDPDSAERLLLLPLRRLVAVTAAGGADFVVHTSGHATHLLRLFGDAGVNGVSITAGTPLPRAFETLPEGVVVLGNLDSMRLLDTGPGELAAEGRRMAAEAAGRYWIATPGAALMRETSLEALGAFVDGVRGLR
jgi:uroporphyrinogen-III decarboxylase